MGSNSKDSKGKKKKKNKPISKKKCLISLLEL